MRLLDGMPYTRSDQMSPDYLRQRFEEIRKEQQRKDDLAPTLSGVPTNSPTRGTHERP